jgi:hypothetical protein
MSQTPPIRTIPSPTLQITPFCLPLLTHPRQVLRLQAQKADSPWMGHLMVCYYPSYAGGIGGRGRIATKEEMRDMNGFTWNYFDGGTTALAAIQQINVTPSSIMQDQHEVRSHQSFWIEYPRPHPSSVICRSLWTELQGLRLFRDQSHQLNRGTHNFITRTQPSTRELIKMMNQESRRSLRRQSNLALTITAQDLAQAEVIA